MHPTDPILAPEPATLIPTSTTIRSQIDLYETTKSPHEHGNDKADANRATLEKIFKSAKQEKATPGELQRLAVFYAMTHYHGDSFVQTAHLLLHALYMQNEGNTGTLLTFDTLADWKYALIAGHDDPALAQAFSALPVLQELLAKSADDLHTKHKELPVDAKWTYALTLRWLGACLQNIKTYDFNNNLADQKLYVTVNKGAEKLLEDLSANPIYKREWLEVVYNTLHITYSIEHPDDESGMAAMYDAKLLPHSTEENNIAARVANLMFCNMSKPDLQEYYAKRLIALFDTLPDTNNFWFNNVRNNLAFYYLQKDPQKSRNLISKAVQFATTQNDTKAYYAFWYARHASLFIGVDKSEARKSVMSALNVMDQHPTFDFSRVHPVINELKKQLEIVD